MALPSLIDDMETDAISTQLYAKALGCILGGVIGDALGTPSEGKDYRAIEDKFGWIDDFEGTGTDDTIMKNLLARALIKTQGYAGRDDWAQEWLDDWMAIFGDKRDKFFTSVIHTAQKLRLHSIPRMAALGNMPSSSSAMAIAPVGIVNACRPRQAAQQAYDVASLIHIHDVGFCQDAAAAIAAGIAEAFKPNATVESMLVAATAFLDPLSGSEMRERIEQALELANQCVDFKQFRNAVYEQRDVFFKPLICDSRETVPLTLALFALSKGDFEKAVTYGANFGRDSDTNACMVGGLTGALAGVDGIKSQWTAKILAYGGGEEKIAEDLTRTAVKKASSYEQEQGLFERLLGPS
ncbi:MAG: ADP-ribosylglycohydrolase family protein [Pseudomonadales bacterium]|nr:ADP-ribosylglycohydrolase family protein [Pseudomonadales bacterium]HJN49792.1 ADP-ribosylglycohydrolase family protein [Pseudomonadales bacterium]